MILAQWPLGLTGRLDRVAAAPFDRLTVAVEFWLPFTFFSLVAVVACFLALAVVRPPVFSLTLVLGAGLLLWSAPCCR